MLQFPKTPSQFRKQAENGFRKANPDAGEIIFKWEFGPKRVKFPTGIDGFSGVGKASAPGFKTKTIVASGTMETGISVR
jgi:hypothetical protein